MENHLVLNSWKEIAEYMGRGVRTVQRYERELRLPVHRPAGKSRSAVIAFADEIDYWMRKTPLSSSTNGSTAKHAAANKDEWRRLSTNSQLLLERADALKASMREFFRLMQETDQRRKQMLTRGAPYHFSKTLMEKTEALQTKMNELSELITRGQERQS